MSIKIIEFPRAVNGCPRHIPASWPLATALLGNHVVKTQQIL
jgi:hypothetical protein